MGNYEKHTWTDGELITKDKMNNIEDGIAPAYNFSKTNLWNQGDVIADGTHVDKTINFENPGIYQIEAQVKVIIKDSGKETNYGNWVSIRISSSSNTVLAYLTSNTNYSQSALFELKESGNVTFRFFSNGTVDNTNRKSTYSNISITAVNLGADITSQAIIKNIQHNDIAPLKQSIENMADYDTQKVNIANNTRDIQNLQNTVGSEAIEGIKDDLYNKSSGADYNLWTWGDKEVDGTQANDTQTAYQSGYGPVTITENVSLAPGAYELSADVIGPSNAWFHVYFYYKNSTTAHAIAYLQSYQYPTKYSATFKLEQECNKIVLLSGSSTVVGEGKKAGRQHTYYKNINLKRITFGVDFEARQNLVNFSQPKNIWPIADKTINITNGTLEFNTNLILKPETEYVISAILNDTSSNGNKRIGTDGEIAFYSNSMCVAYPRLSILKSSRSSAIFKLDDRAMSSSFPSEKIYAQDGTTVIGIYINKIAICSTYSIKYFNDLDDDQDAEEKNAIKNLTLSKIQLEENDHVTPYVPHELLAHSYVPEEKSDILLELHDITMVGDNTEKAFHFITGLPDPRNIVINCRAKWTRTDAPLENEEGSTPSVHIIPEIRFHYTYYNGGTSNLNSTSVYYSIGAEGRIKNNTWRMPAIPRYTNVDYGQTSSSKNTFTVKLFIPTNISLELQDFIIKYDNSINRPYESGLRIDSHGSFFGLIQHSIHAMTAIANCGATHMITIPKCSKDGVWFAYHDDTFEGEYYNETTGKWASKTHLRAPGKTEWSAGFEETGEDNGFINLAKVGHTDGQKFNEFYWDPEKDNNGFGLSILDAGISSSSYFSNTRLMKIEEMLEICNECGVHPVFSCHPSYTLNETESLKQLVKSYNLLDKLTLLPSKSWFENVAWGIFGNDIEMYKFGIEQYGSKLTVGTYNANGEQTQSADNVRNGPNGFRNELNSLISMINEKVENEGLDKNKVCIALWIGDVAGRNNTNVSAPTSDEVTQIQSFGKEMIELILSAGYKAGLHAVTHYSQSGYLTDNFTGEDYKYYQKLGVSIFTDSHNASMGLNWL